MKKGIDISKYQAGIDLNNIKNNGYDFVIIRAGYTGWGDGESKAIDPSFEDSYSRAKSAGLGVGAYYFTIATSYQEGVDEANWLYNNCLKGKQFDYPIYIDVEDDTGGKQYLRKAGKDATTQGIKGFCETLEKLGYYVGIYASDISGFKEMMNIDELKDYDKWVARYGKKPEYVTEYGMWQTTSSGKVNGYSGNLDLNEAYKDYPSIIKSNGLNGYSKDSSSSNSHQINTDTTSEETVYTVVSGDTLSGIASKYGTTYQKLAEYNGIADPNKIYPGQQIKIPGSNSSSAYYTVVTGDNLTKIANRYGATVNQLVSWNNISNPNLIYPGQKLRVK